MNILKHDAKRAFLSAFLFVFTLYSLPFTLTPVFAAGAGSSAFDFLRLDVGAREISMGGAAIAAGEGIYGSAYNPAFLGDIRTNQAGFSYSSWLEGISYQDFLFGYPASFGSLGLRLQLLGYGKIDGFDAAGARTSDYSASDILVGLSYARHLPKLGLSAGGTFKIAREKIESAQASAVLADLGVIYRPRRQDLWGDITFGLVATNIGPNVKFDRDPEPVPTAIGLGTSMKLLDETLTFALDVGGPITQGVGLRLGAEYLILNILSLRAGYEPSIDEGSGVRGGVGFKIGRAQFDYAFLPAGELGQTHHAGITLYFGGPAEKAYNQGMKLLREGKYAEAILEFNETLKLNPEYAPVYRRMRQAYSKLQEQQSSQGK
ncbi:MAG: PorV/PorQ family protein [Elusimicrobia bacterium]|nr:PorV/PorQ family protein [Elusimicrobiota bacterium]